MPSRAVIAETSPYFARLLAAKPALAAEIDASLGQAVSADELSAWLAEQALTEANLKPVLRQLKQRAYARIATRDLCGLAPLGEVVEGMTLIAELAVSEATRVLTQGLVERYGTPRGTDGRTQELIVVGMGKLGGRELNVSSDIDLIFVYPEDGDTDGARAISNFEFFTRLGRALINAIADSTSDGQVFRVDMRLRPNGDSGPLVCSFEMLENYFVTQGREWERYAWIKARPLTGAGAGNGEDSRWDELEAIRRPFVFRKYLDFGTINAMRELHAQIRQEVAKKDKADNVKLGPGGIREIEFIAQVFQLIRGGRDPALQIKPTLSVLRLLAENATLARRGSGRTVGRLRIPAPRRTPAAIHRRCADPHAAHRRRRPCARRARHGLWFLRGPAGRTGRPSRQRRAPLRGGVRRPQSRRAQAGRHVARRGRRGTGRGVRQSRLQESARSGDTRRRAARRAALPAACRQHPRPLRRTGTAADPGGGGNAQPGRHALAQP